MGGTLGLASTVGQGSDFWIELPLADDAAGHAELPVPPPQRHEPEREQTALTVLCIEDNLSSLHLIEQVVRRRAGVTLLPAMRPELGLELAAEHHPDLVLLDMHLPGMSGEEVFRRLRTEPRTADVPVTILSADARPSQTTLMLQAGIRGFLTKPLDVRQLLDLLDTLAEEKRQQRRP